MTQKRVLIGTGAIWLAWQITDFLIHGMLLSGQYEMTQHLWRPMEEMKMQLMWLVSAVTAYCFTLLFEWGFKGKGRKCALLFGAVWGIAVGTSMGWGTYCYQPITEQIALGWMFATIFQTTLAGGILSLVYKEKNK